MASTGAVKESQSTPEGKRTSAAVCADKTGGRRRAVRVGRQPISDQQKIDQKEGGGDISSARSLTVAERLRAKVQARKEQKQAALEKEAQNESGEDFDTDEDLANVAGSLQIKGGEGDADKDTDDEPDGDDNNDEENAKTIEVDPSEIPHNITEIQENVAMKAFLVDAINQKAEELQKSFPPNVDGNPQIRVVPFSSNLKKTSLRRKRSESLNRLGRSPRGGSNERGLGPRARGSKSVAESEDEKENPQLKSSTLEESGSPSHISNASNSADFVNSLEFDDSLTGEECDFSNIPYLAKSEEVLKIPDSIKKGFSYVYLLLQTTDMRIIITGYLLPNEYLQGNSLSTFEFVNSRGDSWEISLTPDSV